MRPWHTPGAPWTAQAAGRPLAAEAVEEGAWRPARVGPEQLTMRASISGATGGAAGGRELASARPASPRLA